MWRSNSCRQGCVDLRQLAAGLHPSVLTDRGLACRRLQLARHRGPRYR